MEIGIQIHALFFLITTILETEASLHSIRIGKAIGISSVVGSCPLPRPGEHHMPLHHIVEVHVRSGLLANLIRAPVQIHSHVGPDLPATSAVETLQVHVDLVRDSLAATDEIRHELPSPVAAVGNEDRRSHFRHTAGEEGFQQHPGEVRGVSVVGLVIVALDLSAIDQCEGGTIPEAEVVEKLGWVAKLVADKINQLGAFFERSGV